MHLKEFLERVLPDEGWKCWVEINQAKKVIQGFTPSAEELATKLLEIDARGSDAYFGCASYKTDQSRRAANVHTVKAFWMDIDAGKGKPYAAADAAIQACDEFCDRAGLPLPGYVGSGGGVHAYWLLDVPATPAIWLDIAGRIKLLAERHGLQADPSRTADIASILRPPQTHNHKIHGQLRPVAALFEEGWELLDTVKFIECVLQGASVLPATVPTMGGGAGSPVSPSANSALHTINTPYGNQAPSVNAALTGGMSAQQAFNPTEAIPEGGGKYGGRNNACAAFAGSLLRKNHSLEDAIKYCRLWNAAKCQPPLPEQEVATTVRSIYRREIEARPAPIPAAAWAPPPLPFGYLWGPKQQLLAKTKELNDAGAEVEKIHVVSDYPVYTRAFMNQEGHIKKNSYLFDAYSPVTGWHEFCLDADTVNGRDLYAKLVENGVTIPSGMDKYFKTYIREAERMMRKEHEIARYSQFGWKGEDSFLVGDVLVKNGVPQKAYGTEKLTPLMRTMALRGGSLEEWTRAANKFFAPGMEAHGFALLCGMAAPLMKFCAGLGDGGSILSLVSEDSGKGKTPISEAIASVWGDLDSTVVTGNFTENRRIESIVRHCNLPQVQEEMTISDPMVAAESVKKFTTGCDRGRLNQRGEGKEIPERYQTVLISVSNTSLLEMVAHVDKAAARRILEIEVERPDNDAFANLGGITREMLRNGGWAGRRIAQIITSPQLPQYLREHLTGATEAAAGSVIMKYRESLQSEAEHRFIVWLLSSVDVMARLATHYGLLNFDVERIMDWAVTQAKMRMALAEVDDAPAKLNRFLSEHVECCLVVPTAYAPQNGPLMPTVRPRGHLYMRWEIKPGRLFIANDALKRWCLRNRVSYTGLARVLAQSGILLDRSRGVTLGAGTDIISSRCYCWEIDAGHPALGGALREVKILSNNSASQVP